MGLDSIITRQIGSVAKNSSRLDATVDKLKSQALNRGLNLLEETGLDPSSIPVSIPKLLRGETTIDPSTLINPTTVCQQPLIPVQKRESSLRLITSISEDVEEIYTTTNAIKEQLIELQKPLNALNASISNVTSTVNSVSAIITTIKLLPFPVAVAGVGIPANILTIYSATLDSMGKLLSLAKVNLKTIPKAIAIMAKTLNATIEKVNSLNLTLTPLLQFLQLAKSVIELQDNCPNVTQGSLDDVKEDLLNSITGSFSSTETFNISGDNLEELLQPNADPGYFYKNYRFTIENEVFKDPKTGEEIPNPYILPSRRIKCFRRNSTGYIDYGDGDNDTFLGNEISGGGSITIYNINKLTNPYLEEGAYSYASDLQVLVNEGEFAVDVYTNGITTWEAPQVRNTIKISNSYINIADITDEDELLKYAIQLGFNTTAELMASDYFLIQNLPNYIIYGSNLTNINNSPTDVAFGANRLIALGRPDANLEWYERDFNQGGTIDVSSYITSGTIQVNAPVNIRMKTFGGTGNPLNGAPRFTEALLTIKRSFSIQDDVNPFTGKIVGSETTETKIQEFENEYGKFTDGIKSINILNTINETFNDGITNDDDIIIQEAIVRLEEGLPVTMATISDFSNRQKLKFIYEVTLEDSQMVNPNYGPNDIIDIIEKVYNQFKYIVTNPPSQKLSKKLFGTNGTTVNYLYDNNTKLQQLLNLNANWWDIAKSFKLDNIKSPSFILSILYLSSNQWINKFNEIYGDRTDYNNGAWVGGASSFPIIPTQVGNENADITIPIKATQLAAVNETLDEIVGFLELLGTYSYDLEIIDSNPIAGGEAFFYPTNFTQFTVEDRSIATPLNTKNRNN